MFPPQRLKVRRQPRFPVGGELLEISVDIFSFYSKGVVKERNALTHPMRLLL